MCRGVRCEGSGWCASTSGQARSASISGVVGKVGNYVCSMIVFDAVAAPDNKLGATGAKELRPALERLTNLTILSLNGTCGDVQRCSSTQCEQWARVGGGGGERAGQAVVRIGCYWVCWVCTQSEVCVCVCVCVCACV